MSENRLPLKPDGSPTETISAREQQVVADPSRMEIFIGASEAVPGFLTQASAFCQVFIKHS